MNLSDATIGQLLIGSAYRVSVPAIEGSPRLASGQPAIYVKVLRWTQDLSGMERREKE